MAFMLICRSVRNPKDRPSTIITQENTLKLNQNFRPIQLKSNLHDWLWLIGGLAALAAIVVGLIVYALRVTAAG